MTIGSDAWDSDAFEDAVTRAQIALYETQVDDEDIGRHWNQIQPADVTRIHRGGVFIPSPDRLIWSDCIDQVDGVPERGCVSIGEDRRGAKGEYIESYFRLNHFRRLDRLPTGLRRTCFGATYESITLWPQDNGPMRASKTYLTLDRQGKAHFEMPHDMRGRVYPEKDTAEISLLAPMQYVADSRHTWTITAENEASKVSVGAHAEAVKSLLYARELPLTASGRKRPILHLVSAHRRRMQSGVEVDVGEFLKGMAEVVMDGVRFRVKAPKSMEERLPRKKR